LSSVIRTTRTPHGDQQNLVCRVLKEIEPFLFYAGVALFLSILLHADQEPLAVKNAMKQPSDQTALPLTLSSVSELSPGRLYSRSFWKNYVTPWRRSAERFCSEILPPPGWRLPELCRGRSAL